MPIHHFNFTYRSVIAIVAMTFFAMTFFALAGDLRAESWTDLRDTRTIEAKMVGRWGDSVVLELQNGKRVTVALSSLKSESRIQAKQLESELKLTLADRVKELQGQAIADASPAPNPLPKPASANTYEGPKSGQGIADFLNNIEDSVRDGHLIAIYDALPPSYRTDVDDIVKLAAEKIEFSQWQETFGQIYQLSDLIVTRQRWFLSSPRIQKLPPEQNELMAEEFLTLAGALRVGLSPEVTSVEKLRTTPFGKWLIEFDKATAPYVAQMFRQTGDAGKREITVDSEEGGIASVTIDQAGSKSKVMFTLVDGYWVPQSLAATWTDKVASTKEMISSGASGTLISSLAAVTAPLGAITSPMAAAGNANDFHAAMESIFGTADTLMVAISALTGKSFGRGGNANNPYGGPSSYGGPGSSYGGPSGSGGPGGPGGSMEDYYNSQMQQQQQVEREAQARAQAEAGQRGGR